ncbi:MAG: LysR substrate-binding domain-containing protein [Oscillospiraceae bacterium]
MQEIAVCGSAYRSLTGSPVTLEALAEYPMISLGADGSAYRLYRQFFAENHVPFEPDIEAATADQILPMVKANLGDRLCSGVLPVGGRLGTFHIPRST